jgi:hypothetical protein
VALATDTEEDIAEMAADEVCDASRKELGEPVPDLRAGVW